MSLETFLLLVAIAVSLWGTKILGEPRFHLKCLIYYVKRKKGRGDVVWVKRGKGVEPNVYRTQILYHRSPNWSHQFGMLTNLDLPEPWPVLEEAYRDSKGKYALEEVQEGPPVKLYGLGNYPTQALGSSWEKTQSGKSDRKRVAKYIKKHQPALE